MSEFVLVHGSSHGGWCWDAVAAALMARGHSPHVVELPLTSIEDDAQCVREVLDRLPEPPILVGHSYGGSVISRAAGNGDNIAHLVYVAAILLDGNDSTKNHRSSFAKTLLGESMMYTDDGKVIYRSEKAGRLFYNECSPMVSSAAIARLRPTAAQCISVASGAEPWRTVPTTYVLCTKDNAIHPEFQRWMAQRAGTIVTVESDHSPFLCMPDKLTDILAAAALPAAEPSAHTPNGH